MWSPRAQADKRRYSEWVHRALRAEPNIEWIIGRAGRIEVDSAGVTGLSLESGELLSVPLARRHDRHVPQWSRARRPGAASVGPRRRAAITRSCGVDQIDRIHVGAVEDGDAATARSTEHRFFCIRRRARRRAAGSVLVHDRAHRARSDRMLPSAHKRSRARTGARSHRRVTAFQRANQRHWSALLPIARGQGDALRASRSASVVSRARRARRRRDLHQRLLDEPAGGAPGAACSRAAWSRGSGRDASRLCGRVRFRATDRIEADTRNQATARGCISPVRSTGPPATKRPQRRVSSPESMRRWPATRQVHSSCRERRATSAR